MSVLRSRNIEGEEVDACSEGVACSRTEPVEDS